MTEAELWWQTAMILLMFSIGMVTPGPSKIRLIHVALSGERRAALGLAIGLGLGSFLWCAAAFVGLASLVAVNPSLSTAITVFAIVYLSWLATSAFRSAYYSIDPRAASDAEMQPLKSSIRNGLLLHLTNPKTALAWVAISAIAISPTTPLWYVLALTLLLGALSLTGHAIYAIAFSTRRAASVYADAKRSLELLFGLI
ncbi:MAG: LysE family transporter, partial [Pseudomonadota bacterium]